MLRERERTNRHAASAAKAEPLRKSDAQHPGVAQLRQPADEVQGAGDLSPELLTLGEVSHLLGIGLRSLNRSIDMGVFPPPIRLGKRCLRYSRRAVLAWIDAQSNAREAIG
jgi:predicted DNA-binding transcriptional regulator AlpA